MKQRIVSMLSACILLLSFTVATAADKASQQLLLGKWVGSATNARGVVATTTFELRPDATFSGAAEMNQKPVFTYSGTWVLNGNQLVWTYLTSSPPLPESAKVDTDEFVSVDKDNLVLISKSSGQRHPFSRVK